MSLLQARILVGGVPDLSQSVWFTPKVALGKELTAGWFTIEGFSISPTKSFGTGCSTTFSAAAGASVTTDASAVHGTFGSLAGVSEPEADALTVQARWLLTMHTALVTRGRGARAAAVWRYTQLRKRLMVESGWGPVTCGVGCG
jgi:hypothetical protein